MEELQKTQKPVKKSRGSGFVKKVGIITLLIVIVGLIAFVAIRFYYPFGEGVKTGELNYVVYKGAIFKTYEGKLIQSGFRTTDQSGIASNEFEFSITDKTVADSLMRMGGNIVELHYKEYFGKLPWRGYSKFIVDGILSVTPTRAQQNSNYPPAAIGIEQ